MENRSSSSSSSNEPNGYREMLEKFVKVMKTQYADVKFCFDCDGEVIKIPAHKGVLAATSPVFNAMFNGELKEKGDVEINDASPAVFEEFLNFFYDKPMQLSMENVVDVLKLADKYDAKDCIPICIGFLKANLTTDDIVWGLHLALQLQLEDLKVHCTNKIQGNFDKILAMFDIKDDGTVQLLSNPDDRFLSEKGINDIFQQIFAMSKNVFSKLSAQVDGLWDGRDIPCTLVEEKDKETKVMFTEYEIIRFMLTGGDLMLTALLCSKVFVKCGNFYENETSFEICIEDRNFSPARVVHSQKIECRYETHVKLTDPIRIDQNHTYFIIMKIIKPTTCDNHYTYKAELPTEPIELTPTVKISFPYWLPEEKYSRSLITRMHFTPIMKE